MLASKTPAQTTSNLRGATSAVKQYVPKFN
jgi:hypothetical protein